MLHSEIISGNSWTRIKKIESKKINLIITSPPYNIGKEYETRISLDAYLKKQRLLIKELDRVLKDDGSICWQVGNYIDKKEVFPLDIEFYQIFKDLGYKLRNRIIWHFGHGLHAKHRFSGRYETILWFTKSEDYTFNLDSVRVKQKYPGKLHYKGDKKGKPSGNPKGKNPSDFWDVSNNLDKIREDWDKGIWDVPNVKSNHKEKTGHPCQFPIEIVQRCILALSNEGDWILDPFVGVGTTNAAAILTNRNSIGIERDLDYAKIAKKRIQLARSKELKFRSISTKIHVPKATDKVVKNPWNKK